MDLSPSKAISYQIRYCTGPNQPTVMKKKPIHRGAFSQKIQPKLFLSSFCSGSRRKICTRPNKLMAGFFQLLIWQLITFDRLRTISESIKFQVYFVFFHSYLVHVNSTSIHEKLREPVFRKNFLNCKVISKIFEQNFSSDDVGRRWSISQVSNSS